MPSGGAARGLSWAGNRSLKPSASRSTHRAAPYLDVQPPIATATPICERGRSSAEDYQLAPRLTIRQDS